MSVARPARAEGIDVHEGEHGLVLHQTTVRVHEMNAAASVVFELCDGTRTTDTIVSLVQAAWGMDEPPHDEVVACIAHLRDEGLLD
jgi:hypothetical protein